MVTTDENKNTASMNSNDYERTSIPLMLGDVIKITSPENEILNDQTFIIDFINTDRLTLINTSTLIPTSMTIEDDGTIGDGSISDISLLYRNKEEGYARQNKLLPGTWINIYFGGDIPSIITGQITDLEEDMIEIKTHPEEDLIYINFDYAGIPEDIPIDLIEIRKAPDTLKNKEEETEKIEKEEYDIIDDFDEEMINREDERADETYNQEQEIQDIQSMPVENVKDNIQKMILQANDVVFGFGEEFAPFEKYVEKSSANVRYSVEAQCNDLLDEMLSTIPNSERTRRVLRNIHTIIDRFKQLRTHFSNLDQHGNVLSKFKKGSDWKPLTKELQDFNKTLYWLIPVAKNVKKVYNITGEIEDLPTDIVTLNTIEDLNTLREELELYKSNSFPDGQNKYNHLIKNIIEDQKPFEQVNFETSSNILYTNSVNANLNVVIDNLGTMYSSVVDHNNINSKRFLIQKYNLGTKSIIASKIDKSTMTYKLTDLIPNDTLSLRSILTLPEPVVRFSKINLPSTSILQRSNLNESFIQYWKLLNTATRVNNIFLNDDEDNDIFDEKLFLTQIRNYAMRMEDDVPSDLIEQYKKFINKLVPQTRVLFNMTKKYMKNQVSLTEIIQCLEPFLIYNDDLTYTQYEEMIDFVMNEIKKRIGIYVERSHAFFKLASINPKVGFNPSAQAIYDAPNKLTKSVFNNGYDYKGDHQLTNSELLAKIIYRDAGRLYNSAIAFENIPLMYPSDIAKLFEDTEATNKQLLEEFSQKDDCQTYHIAKQYSSVEQLEDDNNRDIYYDKKFDKTMYSILDNYEKDMATKDPDEFIDFLVKKLEKSNKLNTDEAVYLAETLISGMKRVMEGDYAFIFDMNPAEETSSITYFKRVNNVWIEDESVDKSMFVNDEDILCNLHSSCMKVSDKCETTDMNKSQLEGKDLKSILNEFDQRYVLSKEDMEFKIREKFEYSENVIGKLTEARTKDVFKYNNQKVKIGLSINDTDAFNAITSPYSIGLARILSQGDFVKKQNDIIRFTMHFTRKAIIGTDESPYWRYCIKTNTPIMPEFRYTLAAAFVDNPDNYLITIEHLKSTIGKISDDGNAWVDKHSGQVIQIDNFEFEDTYVDGFKDISHAILEKDAAQQVIGTLNSSTTKKKQTLEMKMCNNVIDAFSTNMGINIEDQRGFIIELAIRTFHVKLDDEEKYKKRVMKASKDNKTLPSYNEYYNARILYYTMASYLIGIQSNIPSITTRRTFPGCVTSFKGFPFDGVGDDSAINYISCIAYNIRNSSDPWSVLKKKKQSSIAEALKSTIKDKFLDQPEVKQAFQKKADYLITSPSDLIPDELNPQLTWKRFLPPLFPFKVNKLAPLTTEFKSKLLNDLKSGYSGQTNDLLVVESKIIHYSLALQERINKIVTKEIPILKNMSNDPFLENACCSTTQDSNNVLSYFVKKDKEIEVYNNMVRQMGLTLDDVRVISRALLFYSPINTKVIYPSVKNEFNETTIYTAFIVYCKFNTILPIPENLLKFCNEKPVNIQPNESIREMIIKLKNDGRNYDEASLIQLFQLVSRENIIRISVTMPTTDYVQCIREILKEKEDDEKDTLALELNTEFGQYMEDNLETFTMIQETDEDETRDFKNFLAKRNNELRTNIVDFLSLHTSNSQFNTTKIEKRFEAIFSFDEERKETGPGISDSYGYNFIHTMKTFVDNFIHVYPNMILNKVDFDTAHIPSYMGLSYIHTNDLKNIIREEFDKLRPFYSRETITNMLQVIGEKCGNIFKIMNNTPYFTKINYNGTTKHSVFDQRLSILIAEYYVLEVLNVYVEMTQDVNMLYVEKENTNTFEDIFTVESLDDEATRTNIIVQNSSDELLLEGNKKVLKTNIADLILVYLELLHKSVDIVSVSYDTVMDTVFKLNEAEKKTFTDLRSKMTDEQRNVDKVMKITKLGDWGKGLKTGITRYDAEMYDEEKEMMEKILNAERELMINNPDVIERNKEQYLQDHISQELVNHNIEEDAYDMGHMNDDYDDGNYGADEIEDQETYD